VCVYFSVSPPLSNLDQILFIFSRLRTISQLSETVDEASGAPPTGKLAGVWIQD